jgi:dipeptidyl aminopeptidase/acylaminoacyl peptidase
MSHRLLPLVTLCSIFPACAPPPAASPPTPAPAASAAPTPGLPQTDIFLLDLAESGGEIRIGSAANLTDRAGYDNQPAFTPDGRGVLYTSIHDDGQADIYRYDIARRSTRRLTHTPESEYSPTPTPDGRGISVVRVEMDSTQRLWRFDRDGRNPRLVLEAVRPVGYHAWGDEHTLALFVLGEPPTLQLADTRTGRAEVVAVNIGRSLHRIPGRDAISFVHKEPDGDWWIRSLDLATRRIAPIARTLIEVEDYAWTPDGTLLLGQGSVLYRWNPDVEEWWEVADLYAAGVRGITRLAVSPRGGRLAVVGRRE